MVGKVKVGKLKQEELHLFQKVARMKSHHQIIFSILIFFGLVAMWNGGEGLMERYFFPNNPLFGHIFSIALGLVILGSTHYLAKEFMVSR